jgi:hypothetical protein
LNPNYWNDPIVGGDTEDDGIIGNHVGRSAFGNHAFARIAEAIYDASVGIVDYDPPLDYPPCEEYYLNGWDIWEADYRDRLIDDCPESYPGNPDNCTFGVY